MNGSRIQPFDLAHCLLGLLMAFLLVAGPNMAYSNTMLVKYQEQGTRPLIPAEEEQVHVATTFLHPVWYSAPYAPEEADGHTIFFDERLIALLHREVDVPPPKA